MAAKDISTLMINIALLVPAVIAGKSESGFSKRISLDKKEISALVFTVPMYFLSGFQMVRRNDSNKI